MPECEAESADVDDFFEVSHAEGADMIVCEQCKNQWPWDGVKQ
jgi:hypothetical protein